MLTDSKHENLPGDECKNLIKNFMDSDTIHETLEGDMTDSWKVHSRGAVLLRMKEQFIPSDTRDKNSDVTDKEYRNEKIF